MWKEFDRTDTAAVGEMEAFVRCHPSGHFMQLPAWAEVKTYWKWRGVSVHRDGQTVAAMGVLIRPLALGLTLFYIPRGPVCQRDDPAVWEEIMEALRQMAGKYRAILLYADPDELDSNEEFRTVMEKLGFRETCDEGFGNIQPQYVFRLDLADRSREEVFGAFTPKTRYNIGLSRRKGVTVREYGGTDVIPDFIFQNFYGLMRTTGERDRFYVRGEEYFRGLMAALGEDARIYVAYLHGRPVAGSIEVFCGRKAWYLYGASSNEHRNAMPNYLLQWTMIQRALDRDCTLYDFRGVPGNPTEGDPLYGLYRFKKGFSGTYTKFSGLFTYEFRPLLCHLFRAAMTLRRRFRRETR